MRNVINSLMIGAGLVLLVGSSCGCNTIHYTQVSPDGTKTDVSSKRFVWSTESYKAKLPNGAELEASKSQVDPSLGTTLTTLGQGLIDLGKNVK